MHIWHRMMIRIIVYSSLLLFFIAVSQGDVLFIYHVSQSFFCSANHLCGVLALHIQYLKTLDVVLALHLTIYGMYSSCLTLHCFKVQAVDPIAVKQMLSPWQISFPMTSPKMTQRKINLKHTSTAGGVCVNLYL